MNRPQRHEQRPRPAQRNYPRRQDSHDSQNNEEVTLDQYAGGVARQLIKQTGIEDTTQNWRALKRAYLAGYADAAR